MKEKIKSYAKVNLGLHVVRKTKNNYHKLKMVMTEIDLCDEIIFEECDDVIVEMDKKICSMENNLCYKIANYLKEKYNIEKGIRITIKKNIPDGGGLGGGSSNAAVVLKYLNDYWKINLKRNKLIEEGGKFGCDIPFFVINDISKVTGYGEKVKPLKIKPQNDKIILIIPNFKNSTKIVFENHKIFKKNNIKSLIKGLKRENYKKYLFNDLENAANFVSDNKIMSIKKEVEKIGVKCCLMTGSGSTIVCYFEKNDDINMYQKILKRKFPEYNIVSSKLKMYSC